MTRGWTTEDLPTWRGRTVVVTGGSSGIGLRTAEVFSQHGARVIIGARDTGKAEQAVARIRRASSDDDVRWEHLDLADLQSVAAFAAAVRAQASSIDLLVNCAGVMAIPTRTWTNDGLEMHFGTNHIGHFALTAHLLPTLGIERPARVVTVSAQSARSARLDPADLAYERTPYAPMAAYSNSKLANVLFAVELNRHVDRERLLSIPVHPGTANTGIQQYTASRLARTAGRVVMRLVGQPLDRVADPIAFAASSPDATDASFVAPTGPFELGGAPGLVELPRQALDEHLRARLWETSERLAGVRYPS